MGIERVLDLAKECGESYRVSKSALRRHWNQAWFQWIELDVDEDRRSEVRSVWRTPLIEALRTAKVEPAISYSKNGRGHVKRRPTVFSYSHGSRVRTLVEVSGLEPPTSTLRT